MNYFEGCGCPTTGPHDAGCNMELDWYRQGYAELEAENARLRELVKAVLLDEMMGTPDLFGPEGGWDAWDVKARAALSGEVKL